MDTTFKTEAMCMDLIHKKYHPYFQCIYEITQPKTTAEIEDDTCLQRHFKQWRMENDKLNLTFETFQRCLRIVYGSNAYAVKNSEKY
jgi:hypothetical protein